MDPHWGPSLKAIFITVGLGLLTLGFASAPEGQIGAPVRSRRVSGATGSGTDAQALAAAVGSLSAPVDCSAMTPPVVGYEISKGQDPNDAAGLLSDLTAGGFSVGVVNISAGPIPPCVDVLVAPGLARNLALSASYTAAEGATLKAWAASGHGLMLLSDWGFFKDNTQALFQAYGYTLLGGSSGVVSDPTDFDPAGPANSWVIYQTDNFAGHPALTGITALELVRGSWLTPALNALVTTDADASPPTVPVMAAFMDGLGCVVLSTDSNWIMQFDGSYIKQNNARAARQMIGWLNGCAGIPVTGPYRLYLPSVGRNACSGLGTYRNDFEGAIGAEWSKTATDTTPSGRRFLGQFGNEIVGFRLACLPSHSSITLSFDLFLIRSWDGNIMLQPDTHTNIGPDVWDVRVASGPALLHTTFANHEHWPNFEFRQAYPDTYPGGDYASRTGASENNTLGYWFGDPPIPIDSVYPLTFTFRHSADSLGLDFSALGLQPLADESWGLDNIVVTSAP